MNTAQKLRALFDEHHIELGFLPISPLIEAGFEWEVAHFINTMTTQRHALYEFMDNAGCNIEMHIDELVQSLGKKVIDADGAAVIFDDGSALRENGWGQTFIHPVDVYVKNDDYSSYD